MILIKQWWSKGYFKGSKIVCFISKLKLLKENILRWNDTHFQNIFCWCFETSWFQITLT